MTEEELRAREEQAVIKTRKGGDKKVRQVTPKMKAATEERKLKIEKDRRERYCKLFYSDLLTLEEVAKLLDCSWPTAQNLLRSIYFDVVEPNKDEERKDMEFRYADIYNKYHRK